MNVRVPRIRSRRGLRALSALLLVSAGGCLSWHVPDQAPRDLLLTERPGKVRVTREDGTQQVLIRPRSLGDVLAGFDGQCISDFGRLSNECPEIGIPFFEVTTLEVEKRGAALVYLPAAAGLLAVWLLVNR